MALIVGSLLVTACEPKVAQLGPFATSSELVRQQYQDFTGREPLPGELSLFSAAVDRQTQTTPVLIDQMADQRGAEVVPQLVRLYRAALYRLPDADGLRRWSAAMRDGTSLASVADALTASSEFADAYSGTSNEAFVDGLYERVLLRRPDAPGRERWLAELAAGTSRAAVMLGFSESLEDLQLTASFTDFVQVRWAMLGTIPLRSELGTAEEPWSGRPRAELIAATFDSWNYRQRFG